MRFESVGRKDRALDIAMRYGGVGGEHHQAWVIDQMVRAMTGCPMVVKVNQHTASGVPHEYEAQGESAEYLAWVADAKDGEDGPETYEWDEGIAP